jgi:hypothetical protein
MRIVVCFIVGLICGIQSANASFVYATSVHSSTGSFSGFSDTLLTLGAPDGQIVQFGNGSTLTLDFGALLSTPGTLSIFTYDDIAPAAASVALSADGLSFASLSSSLVDTNGPVGSYPHADFTVGTPFRYVRFVDLIDPNETFPDAGFDLDAVGFESTAVPEPSSLSLLGLAAIGLGLRRRSRRVDRLTCTTSSRLSH